ncbi:MAG: hypothetical protein ACE149_12935 [Armatimonadota bacterium]
MSLRPYWAQDGKSFVDSQALSALLALAFLTTFCGVSHALDPERAGTSAVGAAELSPATQPGVVPSPRQRLSLTEQAAPDGTAGSSLSLQPRPGRRLTISLYSSAAAGLRLGQQPLALAGQARDESAAGLLSSVRADPLHATLYRIDYAGGPFELKGHVADVGSRFSLSPGTAGQPSAEEAELIRQVTGGRGLNLSGSWKLTPGLSLTSSRGSLRRDDPLSEQRGLTSEDTSHSLALKLGSSTNLSASLKQHSEKWDRWLGRTDRRQDEQRVELASGFGSGGSGALRLAMTSVRSEEGQSRSQESTREAHLSFSPASRLRLTADHVAKQSGDGNTQTNQSVSAALKLAPEAELTAGMKAFTSSAGEEKRELALSLAAKVLGGQLAAGQRTARTGTGLQTSRNYSFAGQLGGRALATNAKLDFKEDRGDQPDSQLVRNSFLHLDRQLLPWLALTAERREAITGTLGAPTANTETRYLAVARFGGKTELQAGLVTGSQGEAGRSERRLAFSREWKRLRLRAESGSWDDTAGRRSVFRYSLEVPTGDLPDWAKGVSSAHQFEDAQQYYLRRKPEWLGREMLFTGYRLQVMQRSGGDDGVDTLTFAHRRLVAGRYHLQFSFEQRPEGTEADGDMNGRPLPLRREAVEIGGRAFAGLNLRLGLGRQTGVAADGNQLGRLKLGLWGKLRQDEQVEGEVWRETGQWDGVAVERTSVAMLYSRRVSDENRVEFKLGYTWCDEASGDRSRDCRFSMAYQKPV